MSGLVGWVDHDRDLTTRGAVLDAMTATMSRRGPDGVGTWRSRHAALGHRDLAASTTGRAGPGGHGPQPAVAVVAGSDMALVHTGHVENLPALRAAMPATDGASAAELLLAAYLRWGERFVEHLDGMFAVAVWDGRERRLLLARDRMGIKPLYYAAYPGGILFASEPKGVLANPQYTPRLDLTKVPLLLQPRLALPGETPLLGLAEVGPGELVIASPSGVTRRRYWRLESAPHGRTYPETVRDVRALLEGIVSRQADAAGSCAAMLSGGVDSTSVAALAVGALRADDPDASLDSFCVEFDSDVEHFASTELRPDVDAPFAAAAAQHLGLRHHVVTASLPDLLAAIPATRAARDLPGWGQFDASMYLLFARMRQAATVALTGEAADEMFAGYPYYFKPELVARAGFPWLGAGPRLADCLSSALRAIVDPAADEQARYAELLAAVPGLPGEDATDARMREVLYLGMAGPLSVILDRQERMSMASGLEVRFPFCDHRLVQYLWNVPWSMKSTGGTKRLLKDAMADLLPRATLQRRKSAYPHVHNPEYDQGLVERADRIVNDPGSVLRWMFDPVATNALLDDIRAGRLRSDLPGGTSGPQLLIQVVETHAWIEDHHVTVG